MSKGLIFWALAFLCFFVNSANAQKINLISDEETELFLARMAKPLFNAAGVPFNRGNLYIVNDNSLNAFVSDGNTLFINTGTIMKAKHQDEISGVIAHETGHIMGGHILRGKIKAQELTQASLASMLMAGAAAMASGRGDVAMAVMLGSQTSINNMYATYRVEEERSADESGVKLLNKIGTSPEGLRDFMKLIQRQNTLSGVTETPYFRTHPMTPERLAFLDEAVKNSSYKENTAHEEEFLRVQAKLFGYLSDPKKTFEKYPLGVETVPAKYARSIAYFKQMKMDKALAEINGLIELETNNPFFHELKGQMYLETGKVHQAVVEYQKTLRLMPNSDLFKQNLAQAMLEDNPSKEQLKEMINTLNRSVAVRPNGYTWLLLSRCYGMSGDEAYANYASAEYSFAMGAIEVARKQLNAAKKYSQSQILDLKIDDLSDRISDIEKDMPFRRDM